MGEQAHDIPAGHPAAPAVCPEVRVTLLKGGHTWVFRCAPGEEQRVLRAARAISARPRSGLDGFDVAALSLQLNQNRACRPRPPAARSP